jgi:hypothetical protein
MMRWVTAAGDDLSYSMQPRAPVRLLAVVLITGLAACSRDEATAPEEAPPFATPPADIAACGANPMLSTSPIVGTIPNILPLGSMNPGDHTFPSDYLSFSMPGGVLPATRTVVAPADIRVGGVASNRTEQSNGSSVTDFGVYFYACGDVQFFVNHVRTLSAQLVESTAFVRAYCSARTTGGVTHTRCNKNVDVAVSAGVTIGTAGGFGQYMLDFGAYDRRRSRLAYVNQSYPDVGVSEFNTFHTVCPLDYFTPAVKASLEALLGDGSRQRTAPPVCGSIMLDVPNTAKGRWFNGPFAEEDPHLALVDDNVDPSLGAISMGTSSKSIARGVYRFAHDAPAGTRINDDFSALSADGKVYCYQNLSAFGFIANLHVLVQMVTSTTLKIEGFSGESCGDPAGWLFTADGAVYFTRMHR